MIPASPRPAEDPAEPTAPDALAPVRNLGHWREELLQRLLGVALVAGAVPLLMSALRALDGGAWGQPAIGFLALAGVAMLGHGARLNHLGRAWATVGLMYAMGLWLLVRVGPVTQLYLLACPMMAMLLLGRRAALAWLAISSTTLVAAGWGLDLPMPLPGFEGRLGQKWLNLGANMLFVGSLLTLSCAFLLRRLQDSLAAERGVADSLRQSKDDLRKIAAQVPGMVYRMRFTNRNQLQYLYVSPGSQSLFGLTPERLMADGLSLHRLVHPEDRARALADMRRAEQSGSALEISFRVLLANGSQKWVQVSSTEVERGADGVVHNGIMVDITDRKAAEALVWEQAHFDSLTRLPNRCMLNERLAEAMAHSRHSGATTALLLIDLDHFKEVNDTLGHERGDELLVEATRRLLTCVGPTDTVARMGGDEFAVVLASLAHRDEAERLAQDMIGRLGLAFQLGAERAYVSASVGIALYSSDSATDTPDDLLKHADQALYVAKGSGRNRFSHFTRALQDEAQLRMRLARDLRQALDQRQFHVVYQPIVCLATGEVHKAEALLRWQHPERGLISPAVFIPIAESTGLIHEIGNWVFRTAAKQVKHWRAQLHPRFQISVNRSPVQFRSRAMTLPAWGEQLADLGLPGESIAVEITEGLLLDSGPGVSEQLHALREAGLQISLDDFGTGYSAMAYLQKFSLDFLKIDRSFVSGMGEDPTSRALCQAIVVMAHALGMKVVAEGVETQAQYDWLREAGCDYAQGYLMAKPLTPEALETMVWLPPAPGPGPGPQATQAAQAPMRWSTPIALPSPHKPAAMSPASVS